MEEEARWLHAALMQLCEWADSDDARKMRAASLERSQHAAVPDALTAAPAAISAELEELRAAGEDVHQLARLGRDDRAALKARLKELGYKGMRARVKLEEQLLGLLASGAAPSQ